MTTLQINETKLNQIVGRALDDVAAISSSALVLIGGELGLYDALERIGPATPRQLADATGTDERYVRPWLTNQAAAGYVDYSPDTQRFSLSPEQALVFTNPDSPVAMLPNFELTTGAIMARPRIADAILTGRGMPWGDHDESMHRGVAASFRTSYLHNLVSEWLPALEDVVDKLDSGGLVADVGCGYGVSTIIMAKAFPKARFVGIDNHVASIERARRDAAEAGLSDRVTFEVATAQDFAGEGFDLVAFFDAIHDMGDPLGAARHAREVLKPGGTVMAVEPMAGDTIEANFNPVGRMYSAASVLLCSPHAISEGSVRPLGTIATERELAEIFEQAGFRSFRRAAESFTNRVFEARV
jgi:2-polyprenyl-3-methyl-5-hydroxy-6-metoxy-1,4-benzoquinol methylase